MNELPLWSVVIGGLLVLVCLVGTVVERLPFTPAIIYLAVGYAIGPGGLGLLVLDPRAAAPLVRQLSEIAVCISLFAVGLKLRLPLTGYAWRIPLRLAVPAMLFSIGLLALAAMLVAGFSLGAALLLASILAPTDPVLGADVHVERPGDRDAVRFGVTAEGGLNDGLAMPGILLGLGLLGLHDIGPHALRWALLEALWLPCGGFAVGWCVGYAVGRLVLYLRHTRGLAIGLEEFLGFGVMALAYGAAAYALASTFLAVFAAGLALRHIERRTSLSARLDPEGVSGEDHGAATDPGRAAAHLTHNLLSFNARIEHIAELALVSVAGALLGGIRPPWQAFVLASLLFFVIRPLAVLLSLAGSGTRPAQARLIAWFGIRGIGSLYYLAYALAAGVDAGDASRLAAITLTVVALSIILHGVSATPLMHRYRRRAADTP